MTREELIDHLEHLADYVKYSEDAPALREAIEMLRCSEIPNSSDAINRQMAIDALDKRFDSIPMEQTTEILLLRKDLKDLPTAEPKRIRGKWIYGEDSIADGVDGYKCDHCGGFVPWDYTHKSIDYINSYNYCPYCGTDMRGGHDKRTETHACDFENLPSAQPEQRYTEEELRVFKHGISLSLLSKRSAQHWRYDEDMATEIKFLERLYDKVVADMGDE